MKVERWLIGESQSLHVKLPEPSLNFMGKNIEQTMSIEGNRFQIEMQEKNWELSSSHFTSQKYLL